MPRLFAVTLLLLTSCRQPDPFAGLRVQCGISFYVDYAPVSRKNPGSIPIMLVKVPQGKNEIEMIELAPGGKVLKRLKGPESLILNKGVGTRVDTSFLWEDLVIERCKLNNYFSLKVRLLGHMFLPKEGNCTGAFGILSSSAKSFNVFPKDDTPKTY